jgi:glycosyltransferase involved in cell wall biosynthesis
MSERDGAARHADSLRPDSRSLPEDGKASVVIPCYNQAHFLPEAIRSVLSQSYAHFEVIVVDDGSQDDTPEVASEYCARDARVRLIRQENRGLAGARNRGLAESSGEYVVFLDSDDRLQEEALEVGVRELASHPRCAFVSGQFKAITADGSPFWRPYDPPVEQDGYVMLLQYCFGMPAVVTYRRWVFGEVGGFDGSVDAAADWDLYLRIARRFPVYHHGRVVADYRQHGTSMNEDPALMLRSTVAVLRSQLLYLKDDARRKEAYDIGLRSMQADYGVPLVVDIREAFRQRAWKRALGGILTLARYFPGGLALLFSERRLRRSRLARHLQVAEHKLEASERRLRSYKKRLRALRKQPDSRPRFRRRLKSALAQERREANRLRRRKRRLERKLEEPRLLARHGAVLPLRAWASTHGQLRARIADRWRMPRKMDPTVALLPWGDIYEDYLDGIGVSLDEFCTEMSGGYLFGYVDALKRVGVRTVLVLWSRRVSHSELRVHVPTGATVWALPPARAHMAARRLAERLDATGGRWAASLLRAARFLAGYSATTPRVLARVLRQERCSAVLVQEYEYPRFDVCLLLGRMLDLPVLATFQGGRPEKGRSLEGWIRERSVPRSDGLLIGPRKEAKAVKKRYDLPQGAITIVGNPIDIEEWRPQDRREARAELGLPEEAAVACWHGRIDIKRKGLDILVEAWRQVCEERPEADLRLLLCGGGTGNERLRRLMEEAGLRGVHWHDEYTTDRTIVRRQLAASDVFVFPSRHEGFAVAPMEAMACGRAVVACDAPGVADLLRGGEKAGGTVVARKDAHALAGAMGRLLDDRVLAWRLGEAARERIEERYSPEAIGEALLGPLHRASPETFPTPSG